MLSDVWPTYRLRVVTPRLRLHLPDPAELADLAGLAGRGVHPASERPFLTPWTDGDPTDRERWVVQEHWSQLGGWQVGDWRLGLGVFLPDGTAVGMVTLRARDFPVVREVTTSSWLGLRYHGQGLGTDARVALLTLAFDHLDAEAALTEVFQDNTASQRVSRKLGYQPNGISRDARGGEAVVSDRLRLHRSRWPAVRDPAVTVDGIDDCRALFTG